MARNCRAIEKNQGTYYILWGVILAVVSALIYICGSDWNYLHKLRWSADLPDMAFRRYHYDCRRSNRQNHKGSVMFRKLNPMLAAMLSMNMSMRSRKAHQIVHADRVRVEAETLVLSL